MRGLIELVSICLLFVLCNGDARRVDFRQTAFLSNKTNRRPLAKSPFAATSDDKKPESSDDQFPAFNEEEEARIINQKYEFDPAGREKALDELKARARFTARMETTKTVAGKLVKRIEKITGRGTAAKTQLNAAKRMIKPPPVVVTKSSEKIGQRVLGSGKVGRRSKLWTRLRRTWTKTTARLWKRHGKGGVTRYSGKARSAAKVTKTATSATQKVAGKLTPAAAKVTKKATSATQKAAGNLFQQTSGWTTKQSLAKIASKKGSLVARRGAGRRALSVSGRRIALRRAGRALALALPVFGGAFALLAFRADYTRSQEEWRRQRTTSVACFLFFCAACADYVDTLCHFLIAQTLFLHGHAKLFMVESISMACAIVSTFAAVLGELLSQYDAESDASQSG